MTPHYQPVFKRFESKPDKLQHDRRPKFKPYPYNEEKKIVLIPSLLGVLFTTVSIILDVSLVLKIIMLVIALQFFAPGIGFLISKRFK